MPRCPHAARRRAKAPADPNALYNARLRQMMAAQQNSVHGGIGGGYFGLGQAANNNLLASLYQGNAQAYCGIEVQNQHHRPELCADRESDLFPERADAEAAIGRKQRLVVVRDLVASRIREGSRGVLQGLRKILGGLRG
jgi:hypothetical protein